MVENGRPFVVKFTVVSEIRMGSPYNGCSIELGGSANFSLPDNFWQDKCAWSADNRYLVLVKWNLKNNEPGFHLMIYNVVSGAYIESERLLGLVNSISIDRNCILYNKFLYESRNTDGILNGYSDHVYEFDEF